ncbi:MAG TPA: type II toxin-antitoxin system RelE/ParE family toxin [Rhizomicrobium sp.]
MISVVLTREAESDLEDIADHIAVDSPSRAKSFVTELRRKAENIGYMPHAHPPRPNLGKNVRIAVHGRYVIIFRDLPRQVVVLRIVHGARDLPGLFEE